jgi:hypothetical protein
VVPFVSKDHPFNELTPLLQKKIADAQQAIADPVLSDAHTLAAQAFDDVKLALKPPEKWRDRPSSAVSDLRFADLVETLLKLQLEAGVPKHGAQLTSLGAAQRIHLLRAFAQPDTVIKKTRSKVQDIVEDFPQTAADIECGRNPGDVLDPYILAASQYLVCAGDFQQAVSATVAHKALMIIEGLMGHLHEDVIGEMRGNIRVPEPRGVDQHILNFATNPFPGADVMQPPRSKEDRPRFHQIKSKTGSAKGGDGVRLGLQLKELQSVYGGDIFYDALIGNTLRGHRSKAGVEKAAPDVVVLVGDAAFRSLTGSEVGAELLLRVYQTAFQEVAQITGYNIELMTSGIFKTFAEKAEAAGEGFLETILHDATGGEDEQQDSRLFNVRRAAGRGGARLL